MEFSPLNPTVKGCLQGMSLEEQGKQAEANTCFMEAWNGANNDFEKYLAAYFVARNHTNIADKLHWFELALLHALLAPESAVNGGLREVYTQMAACYHQQHDEENENKYKQLSIEVSLEPQDDGPFYHGTKALLNVGDELVAGKFSNYENNFVMNHIYFTAQLNGAGLAAALAKGDGEERVYIVEPTGAYEHDPNVTNKKFPGNPTRSYRSEFPLKIVGVINDWKKFSPEDFKRYQNKVEQGDKKIIN